MKVAVIGSGIIGVTTAYHLLKEGHEVVLIDAAEPGAGSSHGNAGWIVPSDSGPVASAGMIIQGLKWMLRKDSPLYVKPSLRPQHVGFMLAMARHCTRGDFRQAFRANLRLAGETIGLLDAYQSDGVRFEMHKQGLIMAFSSTRGLRHHRMDLDITQDAGLAPHVMTGPELAEREPALAPSLAGGIYFPLERHVRPDTLMSALVARCTELGATFVNQSAVIDVRRSGSQITRVLTTTAEVEADQFLLAAGAHSGPLSALFGTRLPVRPGKGYSVDFCPAPVELKAIVYLAEARVAITPLAGAVRLAGTMEFAGLDTKINPSRVAAIRNAPRRYLVDATWTDTAHSAPPWAGARPMTPDGMPILGLFPRTTNAWIATGHGMLGLTMGPATGQAVAEAIIQGSMTERLRPFDPARFDRHTP
jgi:D-amino-acid dehydrogenase